MSRIHDMGGRFGDGSIPEKDDNVVFHTTWEARAMAITVASGALGAWNIDAGRHARECLRPKDYARFSYYEKWVSALADILVARGMLSEDDLKHATDLAVNDEIPKPTANPSDKTLRGPDVLAAQYKVVPYTRKTQEAPKFQIGTSVRAARHSPNQTNPGGHTRLPAYAMGCIGKVVLLHGSHVLPDSNAHFNGEAPEPLYAVEFDACELWGSGAENAGDKIVLDLWQSYLTAVDE
jgi:nitrile hydratase subunit beta